MMIPSRMAPDLVGAPFDGKTGVVENQTDDKADAGQRYGGLGKIPQTFKILRHQLGVDQGRADDEQAQTRTDADLNVLGNQLHDQLPHPENTQQQENGAGDENHSQAYLPGCDTGENNRIGENRIGPHAGGQREGHVGNQAHDNGDQAGHLSLIHI